MTEGLKVGKYKRERERERKREGFVRNYCIKRERERRGEKENRGLWFRV